MSRILKMIAAVLAVFIFSSSGEIAPPGGCVHASACGEVARRGADRGGGRRAVPCVAAQMRIRL